MFVQALFFVTAASVCFSAYAADSKASEESTKFSALLSGKVEITIKAKSQGEIAELLAIEGKAVKKGDLLVKIDDRQEKIDLAMADAEHRMAKDDFQKTTKLKKYVSKDEVLQKEAVFLKKKSIFELKSLELDNTRIIAPVSGIVTRSYLDLGETVAVGEKVFDLVQLDELILVANVPAKDIQRFVENSEIDFTVERVTGKFKCKVTFVSPVIDASSDTIRVKLTVSNPLNPNGSGYVLKPGMMATLSPK